VSPRTLEVSLPDDLAAEVASAVRRGEYASESDAVLGAVAEWRVQRVAEMIGVEASLVGGGRQRAGAFHVG
jgi:Arc/MetJ-type ribon-helix-helix transcriptional regulator